MKKRYIILTGLIIIEIIGYNILYAIGVETATGLWLLDGLATIVVMLPILLLLYYLGNDKKISNAARRICKILFWWIIICFILGAIVTCVAKMIP